MWDDVAELMQFWCYSKFAQYREHGYEHDAGIDGYTGQGRAWHAGREDGATRRLLYMGDVHAAGVFARNKNVLDMPDKGGCNKTLVLHWRRLRRCCAWYSLRINSLLINSNY